MEKRLHHESSGELNATSEAAFAHLDDFRKLSAHMERPSSMMVGSRMTLQTDDAGGRAVGSHVRMQGKILGIALSLDEVVVRREPPRRKVWRTIDARLLVIGNYELGFQLNPVGERCSLRVFIDYDLPARGAARWLGKLLGGFYARWCTRQMLAGAVQHFAR